MNDLKSIVYSQVDEAISKIQEIVQIPSVRDIENAIDGAPFGIGINKSLDKYLFFAKEIGMRTYKDPDGYYGYAEIGPQDEEMIGIVGHLDVVPTGKIEEWECQDPFSGKIINDAIYGRGTLDDKGPMVIALYAVKCLLESGVKLNKKIRIILGTAEETTWQGINKYKEKEEYPKIGFTPDGNFPLIHSEKTIIRGDIVRETSEISFEVISTGAYNSVADEVIYKGSKVSEISEYLKNKNYDFKIISNNEIEVYGKTAHAAECYLGDNAIYKLIEAMYNVGERSKLVDFIYDYLLHTYNGEKLFGNIEDEISGKLTLNVGWIKIKNGIESIGFDSRIPVLVEFDDIYNTLEKVTSKCGLKIENYKYTEKLYISKDEKIIINLMEAYKEVTEDYSAEPLAIGGGTYARAFKNIVAFGAVFSNHNMIDNMHQTNEQLELKFIPMAMEIYALALNKLNVM